MQWTLTPIVDSSGNDGVRSFRILGEAGNCVSVDSAGKTGPGAAMVMSKCASDATTRLDQVFTVPTDSKSTFQVRSSGLCIDLPNNIKHSPGAMLTQ
ncbi:hypothetical protein HDU76_004925 [Blyttiomyces sp. JEL0837]|nr:hypothetical protein HDU76_004925 [Blyttiomyces sp. JEL0837]